MNEDGTKAIAYGVDWLMRAAKDTNTGMWICVGALFASALIGGIRAGLLDSKLDRIEAKLDKRNNVSREEAQ
jgi:hypothetical protein